MKKYFMLWILVGFPAFGMQRAATHLAKFTVRHLRTAHLAEHPHIQTFDDALKFIKLLEQENKELHAQNRYFQKMHTTDRIVMLCMSLGPTLTLSKWVQNKIRENH